MQKNKATQHGNIQSRAGNFIHLKKVEVYLIYRWILSKLCGSVVATGREVFRNKEERRK